VIEAIAHCALFEPNAKKFASMGVLKDLVLMIAETTDFRSYIVRTSIEAIWNIIEVGGKEATETMASEGEVVMALRKTFERVLSEGYKLDDKCLRNEICILINYIVTCPLSHKFFIEKGYEGEDSATFLGKVIFNSKTQFYSMQPMMK
jgi:hypothetical protein